MNKLSKILLLVLCAALLVTASVMGTLAYLTNTTGEVTNTFTVGNVGITLDETEVDLYGVKTEGANRVMANTYKLIPGHKYLKDPIIHVNATSEDCWVFIKVANGLGTAATINFDTDHWTLLETTNGDVVYAYNTVMTAGNSTTALFSNFTFSATADPTDYENATITLTGYAVQAEGFDTPAAAWAAGFGTKSN